jgi:hypothetical protein
VIGFTGHHLPTSSQGKSVNLLLGIGEGISDGHYLPASSQGKTVNLLLGMGAGNGWRSRSTSYGRSHLSIFSRENHKLVIGKKSWDLWVIAPQILLKGKP